MSKVRRSVRGQPLVALAFILLCWIGLRAASWDHPLLAPTRHERLVAADPPRADAAPRWAIAPPGAAMPALSGPPLGDPAASSVGLAAIVPIAIQRRRASAIARSEERPSPPADPEPQNTARTPSEGPVAMTRALLADDRPGERPAAGRWSADAWVLLRGGGGASLASGPGFASYGASQAGAVLRYRLAPDSAHRPAAYLRATAALNGSGEREVAAGLSARPVAAVPVAALAELRVSRQSAGTRLRPAAMLVTELPPVDLPRRTRAEAYGQAGYVGGAGATAFVDGQIRLDGGLARAGPADVRIGAGAWGGAQKGASRLDLGPTIAASLAARRGLFLRAAADWRFRVAGNAAPASGPALTLSAGF